MPSPSASRRQAVLRGLTRLSAAEFVSAWGKLNKSSPNALAEPLSPVLQALAEKYGAASATLAADWYDESRDDAGAPGSFQAIPASVPDADRFDAMARWGVGPLFGANPNDALALQLLLGGMQRIILDAGRETTAQSVEADPAQPRYARHASANACAFCALMASRGPVYRSSTSAGIVTGKSLGGKDYKKLKQLGNTNEMFDQIAAGSRVTRASRAGLKRDIGTKYHDDCHCTTIEVFPGQRYEEAPYVAKWRDAYANSPSSNDLSKALASMREELGTN